jgi:hypothetical protein
MHSCHRPFTWATCPMNLSSSIWPGPARAYDLWGPGLSAPAARVLAERWQDLGPFAVEVVLDADADLCRVGYCDGQGLRLLLDTAKRLRAPIHRQTGVRLCILEIDGEKIIFPPTPRLVEESEAQAAQIILAPGHGENLHEQILAPTELAPHPLTEAAVQNVTESLKQSPAQPFDLARQVRVLSTKFQFVEFTLEKAALSRKRVAVPPDLLGLAPDAGADELLRASFQLVAKGDEISGETLIRRRDAIDSDYLVSIANYGKIIQQSNRADFDKAVDGLRDEVKKFQESAKEKLNAAINKNCDAVILRLFPAVRLKIPARWRATLGNNPSDDLIRRRLEQELRSAYRNAEAYLERIEIRFSLLSIVLLPIYNRS